MDVGTLGFVGKLFFGVRNQKIMFVYPYGIGDTPLAKLKGNTVFKVDINHPCSPMVSVLPGCPLSEEAVCHAILKASLEVNVVKKCKHIRDTYI